jgi:hypothetical protein
MSNGDGEPFDDIDELDDEAFFAAWEEAERHAAEVLSDGLADVDLVEPATEEVAAAAAGLRAAFERGDHGARWMLTAAGIEKPDQVGDEMLLLEAVASTISMVDDPGLPVEDEAAIMTLELPDWVGAILGAVRGGPGTATDPTSLVDYAAEAEEIDTPPLDADDRILIEQGFSLVLPAWQAAGVVEGVEDEARLTRIGAWVLPRAAAWAWSSDETF